MSDVSSRVPSAPGLPTDDLTLLGRLAEATALRSGRALSEQRTRWALTERVEAHDVKLLADREAESIAIEQLRTASGLPVYSEEAGLVGADDRGLHWVLDPLDGSANYLRGVPLCCVSVALVRGDEPLLGVVYDFNADELFSGIVGAGATLNGTPMRVSDVARQEEAMLTTGFPVGLDLDPEHLANYVNEVRAYRKVRSLGTAAMMLAWVAAGRFDVYRERSVRFWDVAAGMALVIAAGGSTRHDSPEEGSGRRLDLLAWNGQLHL